MTHSGRSTLVWDASAALKRHLAHATGAGVRIAVIDSGWDRSAAGPSVVDGVGMVAIDEGYELERSTDDLDRIGHGSACADLIRRLAPAAQITPIRVFGKRLETSVQVLCAALEYAAELRVDVVNLSLGTRLAEACIPLYRRCAVLERLNTVVVAAKVNSATWSYPAAFDNVLGVVGAHTGDLFRYYYSGTSEVDVVAESIHPSVSWLGGSRRSVSGSSFAAPVISGIVALLMEGNSHMGLDEIRALLRQFSS